MIETLEGRAVEVSVGEDGVFFDAKLWNLISSPTTVSFTRLTHCLEPFLFLHSLKGLLLDFVENDELTALTTAVTRVGPVDTLNSDGPFTLFARATAPSMTSSDIFGTLLTNDELVPHLLNLSFTCVAGRGHQPF
jgi:hypothetical protein